MIIAFSERKVYIFGLLGSFTNIVVHPPREHLAFQAVERYLQGNHGRIQPFILAHLFRPLCVVKPQHRHRYASGLSP